VAERVIGGRTYRYDRATGEESVRLALQALKLIGPAEDLVAAIINADETAEPAALVALVDTLDEGVLAGLMKWFVSNSRENGRPIEDTYAVMDREEFIAVAMFAMQIEFGAFFRDGVGATVQRARGMIRPPA
jgi:hypothetical protein